VQHRNLFQDSNSPKSYFPKIRCSSWHNNEIKSIRRGDYNINNFQYSNKRKSTENKTLGYLPRVLFFNAFELGAESGNQVISSDEASNS
jgi:mannosyltransferase OCH1-like enzyme